MGFAKPTTTQTPDPIFDYWQTRLTGAEMRVLLYAVRRTFGFKKDDDNISLDQFEHGITTEDGAVLDEGCGCSRKSILRAIKLLVDKDILIKTRRRGADKRDDVSNYRLHIVDERQGRPERGFRRVNTTQVPDEVFDYWLPHLSDAELFVLLYIIRRTLGFQKQADVINPEQFLTGVRTRAGAVLDDGCGVSKKHLYLALSGLKDKGLITVQRRRSRRAGNIPSVYSLNFENDVPDILSRSPDDPDPRAAAYDAYADSALVGAEHTSTRASHDVMATAAQGGAARRQEGGKKTPRGEHDDDDRGATGQLEGRVMSSKGAQEDDCGDARGRQQGRAATPRETHNDQQSYASQRAPQQTAYDQQTDSQGNSISKTSKHTSSNSIVGRTRDRDRSLRYSVLVSQQAGDLSFLFHDQDHQRSNRTRALRLWAESDLDEQTFADMMQEARLIAMKRGNIEKDATDGSGAFDGTKNRMPYFFAVLEDLIDIARDTGLAIQPAQLARPRGGHDHADGPRQEPAMKMSTTRGAGMLWPAVSREPVGDSQRPGEVRPGQTSIAHRWDGDGVDSPDSGAWAAMLDEVRTVLTPENYATWLGSTYVVGRVGRVLRVAVPTDFHREWLTRKLQGKIVAALDRLGHGGLQIEYVVVPATVADE